MHTAPPKWRKELVTLARRMVLVARLGSAATFAVVLSCSVALPLASQVPVIELPSADIALSADFEDVFRLGGGDARWAFTSITSLAFDASGNLHIADVGQDGDEMRIVVVDSLGSLDGFSFRA